jgi:hypothetical protein
MDATEIVAQLNVLDKLPLEAIRAAREDRASVAPVFIQAIEGYLSPGDDRVPPGAIFFMFHLLGEWREKSAYRPLARLLRLPLDEIDPIFGGAATETSHRVMAAVFDGDPQPLYDVILDREADEFVRSRMCETIAMVTLRDDMPRAEAAQFFRGCYPGLEPERGNFVWQGWQSAIALLGLEELKPVVWQAFARGYVDTGWLSFKDFESDLTAAVQKRPAPGPGPDDEYTLFGDTIEELSSWSAFNPDSEPSSDLEIAVSDWQLYPAYPNEPATNPFRHVGRNDPCPCGSGKKFKKCCLHADAVIGPNPGVGEI